MRTIYVFAAVLLSGFLTQSAFAKIGARNLDEEQKLKRFCYTRVMLPEGTAAAPSTAQNGQDGVVASMSLNHTGNQDVAQTSSIANPPFPARLRIETVDDTSAADTLSCSTFTIIGLDQFGKSRRETFTTVSETPISTTYVYSQVDSVSATCAGGADALDYLRVSACDEGVCDIGLGVDIKSVSDIESLCMDDGTNLLCANEDWDGDGAEDTNDLSAIVDLEYDYVTVSTANIFAPGTAEMAGGERICFVIRSGR